jgi:hypothetical protein
VVGSHPGPSAGASEVAILPNPPAPLCSPAREPNQVRGCPAPLLFASLLSPSSLLNKRTQHLTQTRVDLAVKELSQIQRSTTRAQIPDVYKRRLHRWLRLLLAGVRVARHDLEINETVDI